MLKSLFWVIVKCVEAQGKYLTHDLWFEDCWYAEYWSFLYSWLQNALDKTLQKWNENGNQELKFIGIII